VPASVSVAAREVPTDRDRVITMPLLPSPGRADGGVASERLDRRLVAVMFTDMVGYTALMQADERLGLHKRDRYMSALESHHDAFGGTIVQRLGVALGSP
jgi:class 3 adenylate cyclase